MHSAFYPPSFVRSIGMFMVIACRFLPEIKGGPSPLLMLRLQVIQVNSKCLENEVLTNVVVFNTYFSEVSQCVTVFE